MTGVTRALLELARATANLGRATIRSKVKPCPPHKYEDGILFCAKCGEYR